MPFIHTHTVTVRHSECDAAGLLHPATMLSYLQDAAFGASDAVGFGAEVYEKLGMQWFAYETEIEYLKPVRYHDTLTIRTWIHDFRRVRSLRRYEVSRGDNEVVVLASTDWVLIDTQKGTIMTIPDEVITAYARGEPVPDVPPRDAFPRFPKSAPDDAFTMQRRVELRDIDPAGHVNNANYIHYVNEAARRAGDFRAPAKYQIVYKVPALLDDELLITTWPDTEDASLRWTSLTRPSDGKVIAQVISYLTRNER